MVSHTQAPWKIEYDNSDQSSGGQWFDVGPARVWYPYRSPLNVVDQAKADANLIAAAPDLLAACQGAMRIVSLWNGREVPEDHEHAEEMKALYLMQEAFIEAIAKAEGKLK